MEISIKDVENLAALSALEFSEEEKQEFVKDFQNILGMVNEIQNAKNLGEDVYNRSHKLSQLREDVPHESFSQEEILKNAPKQRRNCFNVPLVVE
ncbi:MAG: Asp-tRNA(Asn)/Glu-tRNA(Gln) amidotransferase subunit GatC [Clostridia bacterium]|nr:Asp-tRNA(Asn)/Glu-tRNA(Gln) amidotransferase subunit GatC [Clostridia bacterium]